MSIIFLQVVKKLVYIVVNCNVIYKASIFVLAKVLWSSMKHEMWQHGRHCRIGHQENLFGDSILSAAHGKQSDRVFETAFPGRRSVNRAVLTSPGNKMTERNERRGFSFGQE